MKLFFALFFIAGFHAFEITQIEGISGPISQAAFDNESNLWVVIENGSLYKLNPDKKIVWDYDLNVTVLSCDFIINMKNDMYMGCNVKEVKKSFIGRVNGTIFESLDEFDADFGLGKVILDEDDNLFYYDFQISEYNALRMLKPDGNGPIIIKGLENTTIDEIFLDKEGNVYGSGYTTTILDGIFFVIPKEAKQDEVPEADMIDVVGEGRSGSVVSTLSDGQNIFISLFDNDDITGVVKKLSNGTLTTILEIPIHENLLGLLLEDKIIVATFFPDNDCNFLYYYKSDGSLKLIQLSEPNKDWRSCMTLIYKADESQNVYIGSRHKLGKSSLEYLHHDESETIGVDFENDQTQVHGIEFDENGNLWAFDLNKSVFIIENGTTVAKKVEYFEGLRPRAMIQNPNTEEIIVVSAEGMHVISV